MDYELINNEPMSRHTTFRTGGPAKDYYKIYNIDGLMAVLDICHDRGEKPFIIGNGSNLLISDKGIEMPVIDMRGGFDSVSIDGETIHAGAGAVLSKVSVEACEAGLEGMEFAYGIPGTIGGAIYMNAGAYGGEMKDVVRAVKLLKNGEIIELGCDEMDFSYRHSIVMGTEDIILSTDIVLREGVRDEIRGRMDDLSQRRHDKQPLEYPSAGSTFKRPEGYFAGKLIMDSGLCGRRVGGAMVSPKHAGFIINYDNATSSDIYELMMVVTETVQEKFGVRLEPEVRLLGDFGGYTA